MKTLRKSIKLQCDEKGIKYFHIYEVKARTRDTNEVITYDRYMDEKTAEKTVQFIYDHLSDNYISAFTMRQIVFVN